VIDCSISNLPANRDRSVSSSSVLVFSHANSSSMPSIAVMDSEPQPQHPTLTLTSEPLVIFGSPESNAVKENTIRSAKHSKIKRVAATHASTLSSFSRLRVSRPRSVHTPPIPYSKVASHRETSAEPRFSFTFSPDSFAPISLRAHPPEGPVDLGHLECHIDKLPVELLGEIFIRCLPDIYFFLPRPTIAPMLLCQICGYWRRVALATPKLWVRLSVPGHAYHHSSHLSLLELWMDRSLDHSLSLQFGHDITFGEIVTQRSKSSCATRVVGVTFLWHCQRTSLTSSWRFMQEG
jgi:hypothetical protein